MTRATNFGIKRTHVQAGFSQDEPEPAPQPTAGTSAAAESDKHEENADSSNPPPKKKRKRTPKSKRDGYAAQRAAEAAALNVGEAAPSEAQPVGESKAESAPSQGDGPVLTRIEKKQKRNLARRMKVMAATEARRLKRISQKDMQTTCFACREKGHAAKDCPKQSGGVEGAAKGAPSVGICYRCNSKKHTLSRCKKQADPANPLLYASCFVCNGKGHLASGCPENKAKGVYPNGGACKLCGDKTHLAKDCRIREQVTDPKAVLGTGRDAGADEDDFHIFKRNTTAIERDEKHDAKLKEMLDIRAGALSGSIKATGTIPQPKKKTVVFK